MILDRVCFDCGIKYLTDEQKKKEGCCTFTVGNCVVCGKEKHVTGTRNYNYLKNTL